MRENVEMQNNFQNNTEKLWMLFTRQFLFKLKISLESGSPHPQTPVNFLIFLKNRSKI